MSTPGPSASNRAGGEAASGVASRSQVQSLAQGQDTINAFLDRQAQTTLNRLYQRPANCLAIFRLVPMLARQQIMSMLFLEEQQGASASMALADAQAWIKRDAEARKRFDEAMSRLATLNIVRTKGGRYQLNGVFRDGMRRALIGGGEHRSFGVPCDTEDKNAVGMDYLDDYARNRWEAILHYMVGSDGAEVPRAPVLYLLRASGLMQHASNKRPDDADLSITSLGFQFLLEDLNTQLWDLLLSYLTMAESRNMDLVEVLSFIFMLGNLQLGKDYSIEDFTETQLHMLQDFRDYGLVYQRKSTSRRFYPTRLATTLTSNATPLVGGQGSDEERGFVILETNYRVYAYTSEHCWAGSWRCSTSIAGP